MNALILGASGYLGSAIFNKMIKRSDMKTVGTCFQNNNQVWHAVDITDKHQLAQILETYRPSAVIWTLMSRTDERELIEKGLRNLLEMIDLDTRLLFVSTDGIFSGERGNYAEEDAPTCMEQQHGLSTYCNAKLDGESMVRKNHSNYVIVRSGPIYGQDTRGNWDKRTSALIAKLHAGETVVRSGNVYRSFTHVDDLAEALIELLTNDFIGILHAGPEQKESYYTFNRKIANELNLRADLIREDCVSPEEARQRGIILDCSLHTAKARKLLKTSFRNVH